jgi:hypothetical protein
MTLSITTLSTKGSFITLINDTQHTSNSRVNVVKLSVIKLNGIKLSVIKLNAVMLSVVAPAELLTFL